MHKHDDLNVDDIISVTLNEYYEVYIVKTIDFLRKNFSEFEMSHILTKSLAMCSLEFREYIDVTITRLNIKNVEAKTIQAIYSVLQRILTGNLTRDDTLMATLLKIAPKKNVAELNVLVKEHITLPFLLQKKSSSDEREVDYTSDNIKNI